MPTLLSNMRFLGLVFSFLLNFFFLCALVPFWLAAIAPISPPPPCFLKMFLNKIHLKSMYILDFNQKRNIGMVL